MGFTRITSPTCIAKSIKEGKIQSPKTPFTFTLWDRLEWDSLEAAAKSLNEIAQDRRVALIPGRLREGLDPLRPHRRKRKGAEGAVVDCPQTWVAIDLDGVEYDTLDEAIKTVLPEHFHDVSYVWQHTASSGIKPGLRFRLFFELPEPTSLLSIRTVMKRAGKGVDLSIYRPEALLYVATPEFADGDPVQQRIGIEYNAYDVLPVFPFVEDPTRIPEPASEDDEDPAPLTPAELQAEIQVLLDAHSSMHEHGQSRHHAGLSLSCELLSRGLPESEVSEIVTQWIKDLGRDPQEAEVANYLAYYRETQPAPRIAPLSQVFPDYEDVEDGEAAAGGMVWDADRVQPCARRWLMLHYPPLSGREPNGITAEPYRLLRMESVDYVYDEERGWCEVGSEWLRARINQDAGAVSPRYLNQVVECVRTRILRESAPLSHTFWLDGRDANQVIVPCRNVYLELTSGGVVVHPHTPALFTYGRLDFDYQEGAVCPRWERFIAETWPDDIGAQAEMQKWFGYLLEPQNHRQRFATMVGLAGTGKGVLTRVMQILMGEHNCTNPNIHDLTTQFGKQSLLGKRLAIINEIADGSRNNTLSGRALAELKRITGQDAMQIDRKHREAVNHAFSGKVVVAANQTPSYSESTEAITRRVVPFRFWHAPESPDSGLLDKFRAEIAGILNWAVAGYYLLEREGFCDTVSQRLEKTRIREANDPMCAFFSECTEVAPGRRVSVDTLYQVFVHHQEMCGRIPLGRDRMLTALTDRYRVAIYPRVGKRPPMVKGLGLSLYGLEAAEIVGANTEDLKDLEGAEFDA